jgi:hypothetical protein
MKKQFHSMNAYTINADGLTIFYSYKTPILIIIDDFNVAFKNPAWYSSTTTRQVNRYLREHPEIKVHAIETYGAKSFLDIIKHHDRVAFNSTLSYGRLR